MESERKAAMGREKVSDKRGRQRRKRQDRGAVNSETERDEGGKGVNDSRREE